jgi:RHS repeat-associated protein
LNQPAHKTAPRNHTKHAWFYPSASTGKECDEETGYGYFGARYMDFELTTMWLSVDPMADKYPNISPYAYCMWNPIRIVDPNGDTCKFATDEDEKYVKRLLDKNSDVYSYEFVQKYNDLNEATHNYLFKSWEYSDERNESGSFIPNSSENTSTICFTKGETPETKNPIIGASEYRTLFEETFHAWKFETNGHVNVPSCVSEAMAWQFSTLAPGTILFDNMSRDLTLMGYIQMGNVKDVAWEFKFGFSDKRYSLTPLYPNLQLEPDNKFRVSLGLSEWK